MSQQRTRAAAPGTNPEDTLQPRQLWALLGQARHAPSEDQPAFAGRINSLLIAMRLPGNEKHEAVVILRGLTEKRFHHLVDAQGRDCRKEAVETLLACGFPHALNVDPEDLEYARNWRRAAHQPLLEEESADAPSTGTTRMVMWVMVAAAVAQTLDLALVLTNPGAAALSALSAALFGWAAWLTRRKSNADAMFGAILLGIFGAGASVLCGLSAGAIFAGGAILTGMATIVLVVGASAITDQERDRR